MQQRIARFLEERIGRQINRAPSPVLALSVPWISIMLASMVPALPLIASAPLMPPLGFMAFVAWRQIRPGLLPVWAGLPLGMFDDLYSGQPIGSAVLLWSVAMIVLDLVEARLPWRSFVMNWIEAAALLAAYLCAALAFANLAGGATPLVVIVPQIVLTALLFPLVGRAVMACDRFRLLKVMEIG